ncbi:hypothetical protein ACIBCT_19735 [Streptosporangium sp. NPDC050855]|uniref:hypothetical protein n=1 Tax=Streptosporangium sp. NPDC050855 TaxID=3366194 RepID=UPI0037B0292C
MTVPQAVDFGSMAPGTEISWQLGTVTVTDTRAPGAGVWTATVSSTDFVKSGTPVVTISRSNLTYWSGPATTSQGGGTFIPGQPTAAQQVDLSAPRVAFSRTTTVGVNEAAWIPTLRLRIPFDTLVRPGVYTGTLTHSVG